MFDEVSSAPAVASVLDLTPICPFPDGLVISDPDSFLTDIQSHKYAAAAHWHEYRGYYGGQPMSLRGRTEMHDDPRYIIWCNTQHC